jgi:hypothetical protein
MKHNDQLHKEVEKTLQSLDEIDQAKTDAFFYSRLSSKLEHRNEPEIQTQPAGNFAFAFSTVVLLLLISFNLIFVTTNQQSNTIENTTTEQSQWLEEMTYDYQAFNLEYYTELESAEE